LTAPVDDLNTSALYRAIRDEYVPRLVAFEQERTRIRNGRPPQLDPHAHLALGEDADALLRVAGILLGDPVQRRLRAEGDDAVAAAPTDWPDDLDAAPAEDAGPDWFPGGP
jgi:hypothetical protein